MLADLAPESRGERDHAVLRDRIHAEAFSRHQSRNRRSEQDLSALLLLNHPRQKRLDAVNRSPQVNLNDPFPIGMFHVDDMAVECDARVVEQDMNGAHFREWLLGEVLYGSEIGDVAHDTLGLRARG